MRTPALMFLYLPCELLVSLGLDGSRPNSPWSTAFRRAHLFGRPIRAEEVDIYRFYWESTGQLMSTDRAPVTHHVPNAQWRALPPPREEGWPLATAAPGRRAGGRPGTGRSAAAWARP